MRIAYSARGKPLLPVTLSLGDRVLTLEALVDSGSDLNVLPLRAGQELGAQWDPQGPKLALGGLLAGVLAAPLVVTAKVGDLPAVRLGFAWCQSDDLPVVLGQTNFFMVFDVVFSRSRLAFSVVPKGSANL